MDLAILVLLIVKPYLCRPCPLIHHNGYASNGHLDEGDVRCWWQTRESWWSQHGLNTILVLCLSNLFHRFNCRQVGPTYHQKFLRLWVHKFFWTLGPDRTLTSSIIWMTWDGTIFTRTCKQVLNHDLTTQKILNHDWL